MALTAPVVWAELGDTAVYGHVYLWGADGSFNNVCGPNHSPCEFVNSLAVAQFVGFVSLGVPVVVGIAMRRSRRAARFASLILVALGVMATAQTRLLVSGWKEAVIHPVFWIPFALPFVIVLVLARFGSRPAERK